MQTFLFFLKKHLRILLNNVLYPERLTNYPEEPRKNRFWIVMDNLIWLIRHHHAHEYYYLLGFDRKDRSLYRQKEINGRTCLRMIARREKRFNRNVKDYDIVTHDKFVAAQYMKSLGFPVPETLALIDRNQIFYPQSGQVKPFGGMVFQQDPLFCDCICKPVADFAGHGVFSLTVQDGVIRIDHKIIESDTLRNYFSGSHYLIEEKVVQHEKMGRLHPASVNTIRLVTCFDGAVVRPFSAGVRIGKGGSVTDNWSRGGILVALDMEKGRLGKHGFTRPEHGGRKYDRHPDTGILFEGYDIPWCREAIDLAMKLHRFYYANYSIGWDLAIAESGPVFIEANRGWGPYVHLIVEDQFVDKFFQFFG